ncbi:MAG: hypothetical protein JXR46_14145 [Calditrichaceae bacterium]|nr:hypothetical protein [Calditrichaceae bacterium]MBN2710179.1 hypothetical protein [Calditrichaceae bacterium]
MNKLIAFLLLFCSLAAIVGMFINVLVYWFVVDILIILICGFSGIYLLVNSKQDR